MLGGKMDFEIRLMKNKDIPAARDLWKQLPGIHLSNVDEPLQLKEFLQKNPSTCFVAVIDKKLIGTVLGGNDGRRGFIYHLAVLPEFQKQHIGKNLTETCLNALRTIGIQKCHIFVLSENTEGLKFWQMTGWHLRKDILTLSKDL